MAINRSLKGSVIRVRKKIKARNAVLLMGLPGVGLVSKLAVDSLVRQLEPEHFATLYSPHFPNQVLAMPSGKLKPFTLKFYYKKMKRGDIVLLRGDLQPITVEGQYEVCGKLLNFFSGMGGAQVIAMAGYAVTKRQAKPRVYCAATSQKTFNEFRKLGAMPPENMVPIVGMAGLVPTLAPLYKLSGCCLLSETSGAVLDPAAASVLLEIAGKKLGQKFDVKNLQVQARKVQELMDKVEAQSREEAAKSGATVAPTEAQKRETLTYIR